MDIPNRASGRITREMVKVFKNKQMGICKEASGRMAK